MVFPPPKIHIPLFISILIKVELYLSVPKKRVIYNGNFKKGIFVLTKSLLYKGKIFIINFLINQNLINFNKFNLIIIIFYIKNLNFYFFLDIFLNFGD